MQIKCKILFLTFAFFCVSVAGVQAKQNQVQKSRFRQSYNPKTQRVIREDGKNVIYNRHNKVDFDGSLIEGAIKNPSEFYYVHRPEEKFGSLVKKRSNFHKEMLRDTVMIR